jgi:hypothetical protein
MRLFSMHRRELVIASLALSLALAGHCMSISERRPREPGPVRPFALTRPAPPAM